MEEGEEEEELGAKGSDDMREEESANAGREREFGESSSFLILLPTLSLSLCLALSPSSSWMSIMSTTPLSRVSISL
jgi:hypothetical protein